MRRLAILGASGHGKVVADAATAAGWDACLFDDRWPLPEGHWPLLGTTQHLVERLGEFDGVIVAIGDNATRLRLHRSLAAQGARLASIVHPRACISPHAELGAGSVVMAGAVVNVDARLGVACIVNTGATIDHDCQLGDGVHVSPGANLSGGVRVGDASWIGVGSCVKQGVTIGGLARVAAGAVVIHDVEDGATVLGCPARPRPQKIN